MKRGLIAVVLVVLATLGLGALVLKQYKGGVPGQPDAAQLRGVPPVAGGAVTGGAGERSAAPDVRLTAEADPVGQLRIEGQVIDGDERPVAGATVAISTVPPRFATSEGDGSFTFDGLIARGFEVSARKGTQIAAKVSVTLSAKTDPVILRLREGVALPVRVVAAGKPVAGATVEVKLLTPLSVKTGSDGRARLEGLAEGWLTLEARADGHAPASRVLEVRAGTAELEIELRSGARVAGLVLDHAGKPVAGAKVEAEDTAAILTGVPGETKTDAAGRWKVDALAAGTYRFRATHEAHGPGMSLAVQLDGAHARDGVEIRLEQGARIAGKVVDPSGNPVPAAAVRLALADADPWQETRQVFADDQGKFALGGLTRRSYDVLASHELGSSATLRVDLAARPETTDVVLTLSLTGSIEGVVVSATGEPVPEAQVTALPTVEGSGFMAELRLRGLPEDVADAGGAFKLAGLAPGTWRLRARRPGVPEEQLWMAKGVEAKTGDRGVKIVLAGEGKVKGKVAFADGTPVDTFTVGLGLLTARPFTGTKGVFELADAIAGEHHLAIAGPGFVRKLHKLTITAGGETDAGTIVVEKGRSVSGRVRTADGRPIEGAKVFAGRQLFGDGSTVMLEAMAEQMNVRTAVTDAQGTFVVGGVYDRGLVVAAEHPTLGRTRSIAVAAGVASPVLELVMEPFASLSGKVTRGGKPLPYTMVMANAQAAASGSLMVKGGADGGFRFERLTPDTYLVSAMTGMGVGGASLVTKKVTLGPGGSADLVIEIPGGGVTVKVGVTVTGLKDAASVVALFSGTVTAATSGQVVEAFAQRGDGATHQGLATPKAAASFANVMPGEYTVCAFALGDVNDPAAMAQVSENDNLPFRCQPQTIAAAPAEQTIAMTIAGTPPPPAPPPAGTIPGKAR